MRTEDEFELLRTLYSTTEITFPCERQRVQLALIIQLAGITGNRPGALLAICYKHVKITLLPDPEGGSIPRRLIEIAFKHTKGYLGQKESYVPVPFPAFAALVDNGRAGINLASQTFRLIPAYCSAPS